MCWGFFVSLFLRFLNLKRRDYVKIEADFGKIYDYLLKIEIFFVFLRPDEDEKKYVALTKNID